MKAVSDRVNQISKIKRSLLTPTSLLVGYALVDLIWNFIRVQLSVGRAVAEGIDPLYSLFYIQRWGDSLLFLLGSVGLRLNRLWSYCAAMIASGWLLYRGLEKWEGIAEYGLNVQMWSWSVVRSWWFLHGGQWDFPRLILGAVIFTYSLISLIRFFCFKR